MIYYMAMHDWLGAYAWWECIHFGICPSSFGIGNTVLSYSCHAGTSVERTLFERFFSKKKHVWIGTWVSAALCMSTYHSKMRDKGQRTGRDHSIDDASSRAASCQAGQHTYFRPHRIQPPAATCHCAHHRCMTHPQLSSPRDPRVGIGSAYNTTWVQYR